MKTTLRDIVLQHDVRLPMADYVTLTEMEQHPLFIGVSYDRSAQGHGVNLRFSRHVISDDELRGALRRMKFDGPVSMPQSLLFYKHYPIGVRANPSLTAKQMRAKYERCIKKVKPKAGKRGPYGICRAQMQRTYGKKRFEAALKSATKRRARRNPALDAGSTLVPLQQELAFLLNSHGLVERGTRFRATRAGGLQVSGVDGARVVRTWGVERELELLASRHGYKLGVAGNALLLSPTQDALSTRQIRRNGRVAETFDPLAILGW